MCVCMCVVFVFLLNYNKDWRGTTFQSHGWGSNLGIPPEGQWLLPYVPPLGDVFGVWLLKDYFVASSNIYCPYKNYFFNIEIQKHKDLFGIIFRNYFFLKYEEKN